MNVHRCQRKAHSSKSAGSARFSEQSVLTADHIPAFLPETASIHRRFKNCVKHFLTSPAENGTRNPGNCPMTDLRQSPTGTKCAPVTPQNLVFPAWQPAVDLCRWHMDGPLDKSRSLGFSPVTNFSSSLKFPVFFRGWGRAGMTRGTKVVWGYQPDFLRLKNAVFLECGVRKLPGLKPRLLYSPRRPGHRSWIVTH